MERGRGHLYLSYKVNRTYLFNAYYPQHRRSKKLGEREPLYQYFKWMLTIGYRRNVDMYV